MKCYAILATLLLIATSALAMPKRVTSLEATTTGKAYVTIITPLSALAVKNLSFGMLNAKQSGYVKIDENNQRVSSGLGLATGKHSFGIVKIQGPNSHLITVNIPHSYISGNKNPANRFEPQITNGGCSTILKNGEADFRIGGTLYLDKNTVDYGVNKGVYVVQASY